MVTMLDTLEERSKKELEDIGSHEPMIYMDKNGELVPYMLVISSYESKEAALRNFREMVTRENIPRYWTVTQSWVSATRGILPMQDMNRREMLLIVEYDGNTMECKRVMLPFDRKFDSVELLKLSEKIRKMDLERGIELPKLKLEDFRDPTVRRALSLLHPDRILAGEIAWESKEAFTMSMIDQPAGFTFMDRWNFYMEDTSAEVGAKSEEQRIESLVKEMQEADLTEVMEFVQLFREEMLREGYDVPPLPSEDEVRQIFIRLAESGALIKMEGPADLHGFAKRLEENDPRIPPDHIHSRGDE
jgi:hypothetical protein